MKQIRQNVFETNSSSTHAIAIKGKSMNVTPDIVKWKCIDEDGMYGVTFGDYGREIEIYKDASDKISYLATLAFMNYSWKHRRLITIKEFMNTKEMRDLNDCIVKHCGCKGIYLKDEIKSFERYDDNKGSTYTRSYIDGGIDGQSLVSLDVVLSECTMEEFIFSPDVVLVTGSDESETFAELIKDYKCQRLIWLSGGLYD